jgi:hypothetical protein
MQSSARQLARSCIRSQILTRASFFQPLFGNLIKMLEVEYSGKHRMPFSTRKIANKIATALRAELMKQRLACFYLQVTAFERKPGVGGRRLN